MSVLAVDLACWTGSDWHTCLFDSIVPVTGEALFGLLVGGATILTFYVGTGGRFGTAAVLTTVFSGVMVGVLPGSMRGVAYAIMLLGLAAAFLSAAEKYLLNPGVR